MKVTYVTTVQWILDDRRRVERNTMEQNFIVQLRGNLLHNHTINRQLYRKNYKNDRQP